MPSHDPLTAEHQALLDQLDHGPIQLTQDERLFTPRGQALGFLISSGLAIDRVEHVSAVAGQSIVSVSRTNTPR